MRFSGRHDGEGGERRRLQQGSFGRQEIGRGYRGENMFIELLLRLRKLHIGYSHPKAP